MADPHFELVTPEKLVRSEDVYMVVVPGTGAAIDGSRIQPDDATGA